MRTIRRAVVLACVVAASWQVLALGDGPNTQPAAASTKPKPVARTRPAPPPPPAPKAGIDRSEIIVRQGAYAEVRLDFVWKATGGKKGQESWTLMGALRDGKMIVDDGVGLREPGGTLELKNGRLVGKVRRQAPVAGELVIDLPVNDGQIAGEATLAGSPATVKGQITPEAELARLNAVPKDKGWPMFCGPVNGGMAAEETSTPTISDVAQARVLWKSEEIDIGRGMGNINRFMVLNWGSASTIRSGSGAASPVLKGGKVYLSYRVPAPAEPGAKAEPLAAYNMPESKAVAGLLDQARKAGWKDDQLPPYAAEKAYPNADDVILCADAATGKTLWKTVVRGRGRNMQHHKAGAFDLTPAVGNGKIFAIDSRGLLFAVDAETGQPLWEFQVGYDHSVALVAVGNVVIGPAAGKAMWGAYDQATGKLLWTAGSGRAMSCLTPWSYAGKDYLIGIAGSEQKQDGVMCVDAATGKTLWTIPVLVYTAGRGRGPGGLCVSGDTLVVYEKKVEPNARHGDGATVLETAVSAYAISPEKAQQLWTLKAAAEKAPATQAAAPAKAAAARPAKGGEEDDEGPAARGPAHQESNPVVVHGQYVFTADLRVLDLKTGKLLSSTTGIVPANGGYMQAVNDLVFVRRDGTHGRIECGVYKVSADGQVTSLTRDAGWVPPVGGSTTSYHHPIYYPMVDGRVFMRQDNGVYCWDLRAPAK